MSNIDLLRPYSAIENYKNQIKHTVDAYSIPHIVVGEALQNALDSVSSAYEKGEIKKGNISIDINFDDNSVTVSDNGVGFPNKPEFLILGGSGKQRSSKTVSGMVGVGIKVVLYCSEFFSIKSKTVDGCWFVNLAGANTFKNDPGLTLEIPVPFQKDPSPLKCTGTVVSYGFPSAGENMLVRFMESVRSRIIEPEIGVNAGFPSTVRKASLPNEVAYLLACFLQRYSYMGDTLSADGGRPGLKNTKIKLTLTSRRRGKELGEFWSERWGNDDVVSIEVSPKYLEVDDTIKLTKIKRPTIFNDALGHGGKGLERTASGFNSTQYLSGDFDKLLRNSKGELPRNIDKFQEKLFPRINCIKLTIGRIPQLSQYLPQGARRVLSANGVVTEHDLEITSGKNQQYVRCVDLVIDLDAELNYGKTQITNGYLVGMVRDFVNEAYRRTIQNAAAAFVGKVGDGGNGDEESKFWERPDIVPLVVPELKKQPVDENDVIALFVGLVTSHQLRGYAIYGFSQSDQYDSRMVIQRDCDAKDLISNHIEKDLRVVEFKVNVGSIVRDIESDVKEIKDMDLLVAWDEGSIASTRLSLEKIEYSPEFDSSPKKVFSGVTHFLNDNRTGKRLQVLLLRDFISK